jgi:hypothetical protein
MIKVKCLFITNYSTYLNRDGVIKKEIENNEESWDASDTPKMISIICMYDECHLICIIILIVL